MKIIVTGGSGCMSSKAFDDIQKEGKKSIVAALVGSKVSGNQIAIFNSLNKLLSEHYDLHLVVSKAYQKEFISNGRVHAYKSTCKFNIISGILDSYNYFVYIAHIRPQVLYHICTPKRMGLTVALIGKLLGIPSIVTMSGEALYGYRCRRGVRKFTSFVGSYFSRLAFILASKIVCIGDNLKVQLLDHGFPASKIRVIPQPIDFSRFNLPKDKYEYKDKIRVPHDKTIVLFVGRLTRMKGADKLYSIVSRLIDFGNDHFFVLVGDGPYKKRFKILNGKNIRCVGNIPHANIDVYYKAADVTVFTSITEGSWPNVVLESLACGVPVVSGNVGAVSEIVSNICTSVDEYVDCLVKRGYKLDLLPKIFNEDNMKEQYLKLFNDCIYSYGKQ